MNTTNDMTGVRNLVAAALAAIGLVLACASAQAQSPPDEPSQAQPRPPASPSEGSDAAEHVAVLKRNALQLLSGVLGQRLQAEYPPATRLSLYVQGPPRDELLVHAAVLVDGKTVAKRDYTPIEGYALQDHKALQRIARLNVSQGRHKLEMNYRTRGVDSGSTRSGRVQLSFTKKARRLGLVLPAGKGRKWKLHHRKADARLGQVRFLYGKGRHFAALLQLLEIRGDTPNHLSGDYYVLWADALINFGLPDAARHALHAAGVAGKIDTEYYDAILGLADLRQRRGEVAAAWNLLEPLDGKLKADGFARWQDLAGRVLMLLNKPDRAVGALGDSPKLPKDNATAVQLAPYRHFNLAMALVRDDLKGRARKVLLRLAKNDDAEARAPGIHDRANLALGFLALQQEQRDNVRHALARVRPDGRYRGLALLGLGWNEAEAIAAGPEPPDSDDIVWLQHFGIADGASVAAKGGDNPAVDPKAGQGDQSSQGGDIRARQALAAFADVASGDPLAATTQEAVVAMPYLYEEIGAERQAMAAYRVAVKRLTGIRARMLTRIKALRAGHFPDSVLHPDDPGLPSALWLVRARTSERVSLHVDNVRELQLLQGAVQHFLPQRQGLVQALGYAAMGEVQRGQNILADGMSVRRDRLTDYLVGAHLGMARIMANQKLPKPKSEKK